MKLSNIHKINLMSEGRVLIHSEFGHINKIPVFENPNVRGIVGIIDKSANMSSDLVGGWITAEQSIYLWNRPSSSHKNVAKQCGIHTQTSIAFYIEIVEKTLFEGKNVVTLITVLNDDFSGKEATTSEILEIPAIAQTIKTIEERSIEIKQQRRANSTNDDKTFKHSNQIDLSNAVDDFIKWSEQPKSNTKAQHLSIAEGRISLKPEYESRGKVTVFENPSPLAILYELKKHKKKLGGWLYGDDMYIWERSIASHHHIKTELKIDWTKAVAFYIKPTRIKSTIDGTEILEIDITLSEFSGNYDEDKLMNNKVIQDLIKIVTANEINDRNSQSQHQNIDEGKKIIDDEISPGRKLWVLEDPSASAVVNALDQVDDTLGGWISPIGSWVWNRFKASHEHVAKTMGIKASSSVAFYIKPEEKINGKIVDVTFETSEFSGRDDIDGLMTHPLIMNIMTILAKRKEEETKEPEYSKKFDYDELLSSLHGTDY